MGLGCATTWQAPTGYRDSTLPVRHGPEGEFAVADWNALIEALARYGEKRCANLLQSSMNLHKHYFLN
jgi:hypothetical protein